MAVVRMGREVRCSGGKLIASKVRFFIFQCLLLSVVLIRERDDILNDFERKVWPWTLCMAILGGTKAR